MVLALELTKKVVLERLKKILKGVSIVPHTVPEYRAKNPPPAVSYFISASIFLYISFIAGTFCLHFSYFSYCYWLSVGFGSKFHRSDPR
jgi:hypothetical protein